MNKNFSIETRYNTLKMHKENYDNDLKIFLESYSDNLEIDFLEIDLFSHKAVLEACLTKTPDSIKINEGLINQRRINSQRRIIEFTEKRIAEIKNELKVNENSLNWQGTTLQFTELTKALFETKLISPELLQKDFFKKMKLFFNVNGFEESDKIKEIVNRTNTPTPFINILEISLNNYRDNQLEKRKNK